MQREVIQVLCKIPYEIEVEEESLQSFRQLHPRATEMRRKVNLLSLSTCLQKTTGEIIMELRSKDLKFRLTEETMQIVLMKDFEEVPWIEIGNELNKIVEEAA